MPEEEPFTLDGLTGGEFEEFIGKIMHKIGYINVKVTQKTNDKGVDIFMTYRKDNVEIPVIVECKHQQFVGRPVIQKLQGAMEHERKGSPLIKGIVVTSGQFSNTVKEYVDEINTQYEWKSEIELIDGKRLKSLCKEYSIPVLNGKVQIISDKSVTHLDEQDMQKVALEQYKSIIGAKDEFIHTDATIKFIPVYKIQYNINSETATNVGTIYDVHEHNRVIIMKGDQHGVLEPNITDHYLTHNMHIEIIPKSQRDNVIPYEYTEEEIENDARQALVNRYTSEVHYTGRNNVSYSKTCSPKSRDIDINTGDPIYLPLLTNKIKILQHKYAQKAFANGQSLLFRENKLQECIICGKIRFTDRDKGYLCNVCGKILCNNHKKLDALDTTPICLEHAIPRRLFIQKVYFISSENLKKYNGKWAQKNIFEKIQRERGFFHQRLFELDILQKHFIKEKDSERIPSQTSDTFDIKNDIK